MTTLLDRPIAFHRAFATLTGSVTAAVMLSQALYWSKRGEESSWFWKTREQWEDETGLSRREQESARRAIREAAERTGMAFWQEEERGMPSRLWYRVDEELLLAALQTCASVAQSGANVPTRRADSAQQVGTKRTNKKGGTVPTSRHESAPHIKETETTTETTTETLAQPAVERVGEKAFAFELWFEKTFWPAYPNKAGKAKAKVNLAKQVRSRQRAQEVMEGLERWKASHQWQRDGGQYVPHGSTWVNNQLWMDEPESADAAAQRLAKEGKPGEAPRKVVIREEDIERERAHAERVVSAPRQKRPIPEGWLTGVPEEEARYCLRMAFAQLKGEGILPVDDALRDRARLLWQKEHPQQPPPWNPQAPAAYETISARMQL